MQDHDDWQDFGQKLISENVKTPNDEKIDDRMAVSNSRRIGTGEIMTKESIETGSVSFLPRVITIAFTLKVKLIVYLEYIKAASYKLVGLFCGCFLLYQAFFFLRTVWIAEWYKEAESNCSGRTTIQHLRQIEHFRQWNVLGFMRRLVSLKVVLRLSSCNKLALQL